MTEQDVTHLLHRAAGEAPPAYSDLVEGGVRRGTRLRRRRRAAVGTTVGVAVIAVAALAVPGLTGDDPTRGTAEVAAPTATAAPPAPVTTSWVPPNGERPDVDVFREVVGPAAAAVGEMSDVSSYDYGGETGMSSVRATVTDEVGPADVGVWTSVEDPSRTGLFDCASEGYPGGRCRVLADGTLVSWGVRRTYADQRDQGEIAYLAKVHHPDGLRVYVDAYNGPGEKLGATRDEPALDLATVKAIALDERWSEVRLPE